MSVNFSTGVASNAEVYNSYQKTQTNGTKKEKVSAEAAAVYEKSSVSTKAAYSINKMSESDRAAIVEQLKADSAARQNQMTSLVQKMMTEQAGAFNGTIWEFLASGNFTVDEAARKQAEEAISENGYYGVKQTSERLFSFASALAGDDVEKMKEMQAAMEKGFRQATRAWGKELPEICGDTLDAANKLFEDYYASKEV